jgi:hypothetical protein
MIPEKGERYQGLTVSQWESEIQQWEPWLGMWSNHTGLKTVWGRKQPPWAPWLERIGIKTGEDRHKMPLLQGDPAAVPVLAELLASRDARARQMAAEGLEKVGAVARPAVPALLRVLDDQNVTVRQQAEQALYRIDRDTAERVGLEWTMLGLMRRDRCREGGPNTPQ